MDKHAKEFITYLLNIGILNTETSETFLNLIHSKDIYSQPKSPGTNNNQSKTNIITDDLVISTLVKYIQSLSIENLTQMVTEIYNKYVSEKNNQISNILFKLINIYIKSNIKFYLIYWKKLSIYLKHKDQVKKLYNNNNYKTTPNLKTKGKSYSKINIKTSEFLQRQDNFIQLKNFHRLKYYNEKENELKFLCTFNPKLNKKRYYSNSSNIPSVLTISNNFNQENNLNSREYNSSFINISKIGNSAQRLYNYHNYYKIKKKKLKEAVDNERGLNFKPLIHKYK